MVLFEVLCGRLCFIVGDDGFLLSAKSIKNYYEEKKLDEIVDPILREQMSSELMNHFATIAYNCLNDDRSERPPMDLVAKELEELLRIQLSSYPLETPRKISLSLEASYRPDVELHTFDKTLQARAKTVIDAYDLDVEDRAITYDSLKEATQVFLKMDQDAAKIASNSIKGIGNNQKWVKLVKDYLDANSQTLDLIDSLRTCLMRARESRLLIHEAVLHFDDVNGVKENSYGKTLDNLKKYKAAGDPFTQDFFRIFNFVYKRQITFLEKLGRKKIKLDKELKQIWIRKLVFSFSKNLKNEIKGHKEVFGLLQVGSFVVVKDLDNIQTLVNRLQMDIESEMMNADFAIKMEDAVKYVIENIKKQLNRFSDIVDDLERMANGCINNIERARTIVLRSTIKPPSNQ